MNVVDELEKNKSKVSHEKIREMIQARRDMFGSNSTQTNAVYGMLFGEADPEAGRYVGSARSRTDCEIIQIDIRVFDDIYKDEVRS